MNKDTITSGAADLPEALRLADECQKQSEHEHYGRSLFRQAAAELRRLHTESEMRRAALLDEMQKAALAAGQVTAAQQGAAYADAHGAIMGAACDFRDAHISGSPNQKRSAHAALESAVTHTLRASHGQASATAQAEECVPAPAPPPECETEAEKRAFAFGWFKALESERMKADNKKKDPL